MTALRPGDRVWGCAGGVKGHGGALAEFMAADASLLARAPASLDLVDAAALPVAGLTAWEALVERAGIRPGQRVLVHGGTGGVGHIGVQLARQAGAFVDATVSTAEKAEQAKRLGAETAIRYREETVEQYVARRTDGDGYDVVFDTVGGECLAAAFRAVRASGTVVTIAARSTQDLAPLHAKGATLHAVFILLPLLTGRDRERHGRILSRVAAMADAGRLSLLADPEVFPFAAVADAHRKLESGRAIGKIRLRAAF